MGGQCRLFARLQGDTTNGAMKLKTVFLLMLLLAGSTALGHPEDELCVPGQDGMDPALCAALAEMNSAEGDLS